VRQSAGPAQLEAIAIARVGTLAQVFCVSRISINPVLAKVEPGV